jgi:hypothetical protein
MSRGKRKHRHPAEEQAETIADMTQDAPAEHLTDEQVLDVAEAIRLDAPQEISRSEELRETLREVHGDSHAPPVCPFPGDPSMGDKDPEVVAWYRDNAPEEFERRYANRTIPTNLPEPKIETGPPTDFDDEEEPVKKPHVILS